MAILGIGHDVVDCAFREQRDAGFAGRTFSARELRPAQRAGRKNDSEAVHLAGSGPPRSVVKSWCAALGSGPAPYARQHAAGDIEVLNEANRVHIVLSGEVNPVDGVGQRRTVQVCASSLSISHDGPASAINHCAPDAIAAVSCAGAGRMQSAGLRMVWRCV